MAKLPQLASLVERHKKRNFTVLGVYVDDDKAAFLKQAGQRKLPFANIFEGRTRGPLARQWGVEGLPALFVLNAHGTIRHRNLQGKDLTKAVDRLLGG